jgi:hypothetical protein
MSHLRADDFESQLPNLDDYYPQISSPNQGSDGAIQDEFEHDTRPEAIGFERNQDSIRSRVEETQFVPIEIDTQAPENTSFVVAKQKDNITLPSHSAVNGTSFISTSERFEADDITSGFTFGKAPKTKIGQFTSRAQKNVSPPIQRDEKDVEPVAVTEQPQPSLRDTTTTAKLHDSQRAIGHGVTHINYSETALSQVEPLYQPTTGNDLGKCDSSARLLTRGGSISNTVVTRSAVEPANQQALRIIDKGPRKTVRMLDRLPMQAPPLDQAEKTAISQSARLRSAPRRIRRDLPEVFSGGLIRTPKAVTRPFPEVQQAMPRHFQSSPAAPSQLPKPTHRHDDGTLSSFPDKFQARKDNSTKSLESPFHGEVQTRTGSGNLTTKSFKQPTQREILYTENRHHVSTNQTMQKPSLPLQVVPDLIPPSTYIVVDHPSCLPSNPRPRSRSNMSAFRVRAGDDGEESSGDTNVAVLPGHRMSSHQEEDTFVIQHQTSPTKENGLPPEGASPPPRAVSANSEAGFKRHTPETPQVLRPHHANRVGKTARSNNRSLSKVTVSPQRTNSPKHSMIPNSKACLKYLKACEEILEAHDSNVELLKAQQAEIKTLKSSQAETLEKLRNLEEDKSTLIQKVEKYINFGKTYKEHMNKVVDSQNALKFEASKIRDSSAKAIEACTGSASDARNVKASAEDKIAKSLQEIKAIRLESNQLSAEERTALSLARQAATTSKEKAQELEKRLEEVIRKEKEASEKIEQGMHIGKHHHQ